MEHLLNQILQEIQTVKQDIHKLHTSVYEMQKNQDQMASQINNIYQSVVHLENGQPQDIYALLERIHMNIIQKDSEISVLNKRVFKLESDFERINRQ